MDFEFTPEQQAFAAEVKAFLDANDDPDVFDVTVFIAFRLAFSPVTDALGALPDRQLAEDAPPAVRAAVGYGRSVSAVSSTDS